MTGKRGPKRELQGLLVDQLVIRNALSDFLRDHHGFQKTGGGTDLVTGSADIILLRRGEARLRIAVQLTIEPA